MSNTAANLVGAQLQFGNITGDGAFMADTNAQIRGITSGNVRIEASALTITGNTTMQGHLTASGGLTVPSGTTISGNAASASQLQTARNIAVSGDISGNANFNGTTAISISSTINAIRGITVNTLNTNPTGSARLNLEGHLYATRVYNAVWNDIVDFIEIDRDMAIEYGRVYIRTDEGQIKLSSKRGQRSAIGIASDTYGFGVGHDVSKHQIPIAIGGFVLAHVDKLYPSGTALTCSTNGALTKASLLTRLLHPERILGIYYKSESLGVWNTIKVKNRSWIKII